MRVLIEAVRNPIHGRRLETVAPKVSAFFVVSVRRLFRAGGLARRG
jgi:hypothetical protein